MKTTKKPLGKIRRVAACLLVCMMCLIAQGCELLFMAFVGAIIEGEAGYNNYLDKEYLRSKYEKNMTSEERRAWNKLEREIKRNMSPEQKRTLAELEREVKREIAEEKRNRLKRTPQNLVNDIADTTPPPEPKPEPKPKKDANTLAHERVGKRLEANGISWHSSSFGDNSYNPSRVVNNTSFVGIKNATVQTVITLKKASHADIVITGATEDGHDSVYHATGNELDLRKNAALDSYIEKHYAYIGTNSAGHKQYQAKSGNIYEDALNHWDVFVGVKPADLAKTEKPAKGDPRLSGKHWVTDNPGSKSLDDLDDSFETKVRAFKKALEDAGATVTINATFRTKERAALMNRSWRIAKKQLNPLKAEPIDGVDIVWTHYDAKGKYDKKASVQAAIDMMKGFQTGGATVAPSDTSYHITGRAIDMNIKWEEGWGNKPIYITDIKTDDKGKPIKVKTEVKYVTNEAMSKQEKEPKVRKKWAEESTRYGKWVRPDLNPTIIKIGENYGVKHYVNPIADPPHWSDTGN